MLGLEEGQLWPARPRASRRPERLVLGRRVLAQALAARAKPSIIFPDQRPPVHGQERLEGPAQVRRQPEPIRAERERPAVRLALAPSECRLFRQAPPVLVLRRHLLRKGSLVQEKPPRFL